MSKVQAHRSYSQKTFFQFSENAKLWTCTTQLSYGKPIMGLVGAFL